MIGSAAGDTGRRLRSNARIAQGLGRLTRVYAAIGENPGVFAFVAALSDGPEVTRIFEHTGQTTRQDGKGIAAVRDICSENNGARAQLSVNPGRRPRT